MPGYDAIRRTPIRQLPSDLADREAGEAFTAQRQAIEHSIRQPPRRPREADPIFVELLTAGDDSVLTVTLPGDRPPCLPIFTSQIRAADYTRTLLVDGPAVRYLSSSALELVQMLRALKAAGIETFALDRCPRCDFITTVGFAPIMTADDLITCWCIIKATELARLDLFLSYAQDSARAGELETAREVVLHTMAHVSFEDPRTHFLIGQIAVALKDRSTLREAKAFLRYLNQDSWERKLDETAGSRRLDFELSV